MVRLYRGLATLMMFLFMVTVATLAWAAAAATAEAAPATAFGAQVMAILLPALLAGLAGALGLVTKILMDLKPEVVSWIKQRVKSSKLQGILGTISSRAIDVVAETYQLSVKVAIEKSKDGKLSADDRRDIKDAAMSRLTLLLPKNLWNYLTDEGYNVTALTSAAIEEAVVRMKNVGKAAKGASTAPKG